MEPLLTEHAPVTKLISILPKKAQKGLFSQDIVWTCIAANDVYIALGSNIGTVFLYHRNNSAVDRLTCKDKTEIVSCVAIQRGSEDVVAAGTSSGAVCVFLLPSTLPGRNKQLQMYIVGHSHHSAVRSLGWSLNAMRLFSGDEDGVVICTEIDYVEEQSKSFHVHKEPHAIVQLCYAQKTLLVSTTFRSFLIIQDGSSGEVVQIGQKDRKSRGPYGACFLPDTPSVIYAARPGLRLWKASNTGQVEATFILKHSLHPGLSAGIDLLPDISLSRAEPDEPQLGRLLWHGDLIVTAHGRGCYLIDPGLGTIVAHHRNLGTIMDVAVSKNEIFILRHGHDRPIIRLAKEPDSRLGFPGSHLDRLPGDSPINILSNTATKMSEGIVGALKNVSHKWQTIQDGQEEGFITPPWGAVGVEAPPTKKEDSISPDTDSAIEANSGLSSPTDEKVDESAKGAESAEGAEESVKEAEKDTGKAEESTEQASIAEQQNPPGAPPIIRLESSDLVSLKVDISQEPSPQKSRPKYTLSPDDITDDIVFSSQLKRKKNRKKRGPKSVKDKDTISISSIESGNTSQEVSCEVTPARASSPQLPQPVEPPLCDVKTVETQEETTIHAVQDSSPGPPDSMAAISLHETKDDTDETIAKALTIKEEEIVKVKAGEPNEADKIPALSSSPIPIKSSPEVERKTSDEILKEVLEGSPFIPDDPPDFKISISDKRCVPVAAIGGPAEVPPSSVTMAMNSALGSPEPTSESPYFPNYQSLAATRQRTPTERTEDFYSKYRTYSISPPERTFSECLEPPSPIPPPNTDVLRVADAWSTFAAPGNVQSLSISEKHVWIVDRNDRLHYSWLGGQGLRWKQCQKHARQVAVSPSGFIVWRLHKGSAYAGTGVSTRSPEGSKWVEVARGVAHIAVDNHVAWYIKESGELMVQKGLQKDRPSFRSERVPCDDNLVGLACLNGVVWAMNEQHHILVRVGIQPGMEEGSDWTYLQGLPVVPSCFCLGDQETAWVLDLVGRVWFTCEVTSENPQGSGQWWQVSLSSYLMADASALDILKQAGDNLQRLFSPSVPCGQLTASVNGVWVCPNGKNVLHVCRGSLIGHRWETIVPSGLISSTQWSQVSASGLGTPHGLLWAQQPDGQLFCLAPEDSASSRIIQVIGPEPGSAFHCLSASAEAIWGLSSSGRVFIRGGVTPHCPQGTQWRPLDLSQLGNVRLISLSCGLQNVWAVDHQGGVVMRIGLGAPSPSQLNPAWVPVEGSTCAVGARFTSVAVAANDWMVWALDSKNNVYARRGVTDSLPIGTHWVYVEGTTAVQLTLSEHYVYALKSNGEILVRYGVTPQNILGDYWRAIPGVFQLLSVAYDDRLWGLTKESALRRRHLWFLDRKAVLEDLDVATEGKRQDSVGEDWEVI